MIRIRPLEPRDEPLLPRFLALAAHEEDVSAVLASPNLARYAQDWGRDGDVGVVAQDEETGEIVGIAWARLWTKENHGFGWLDERTPELAISVESQFQNQGIGSQLIVALKEKLTATDSSQVVLNVRADSPAVRLYERLGFREMEGSHRKNRTGSISFNMLARL